MLNDINKAGVDQAYSIFKLLNFVSREDLQIDKIINNEDKIIQEEKVKEEKKRDNKIGIQDINH